MGGCNDNRFHGNSKADILMKGTYPMGEVCRMDINKAHEDRRQVRQGRYNRSPNLNIYHSKSGKIADHIPLQIE